MVEYQFLFHELQHSWMKFRFPDSSLIHNEVPINFPTVKKWEVMNWIIDIVKLYCRSGSAVVVLLICLLLLPTSDYNSGWYSSCELQQSRYFDPPFYSPTTTTKYSKILEPLLTNEIIEAKLSGI